MSAVLLIPAAVGQSRLPAAYGRSVPAGVLAALGQVADPRRRRGVRHGCTAVLAIAVCAVLAGARSYLGIGQRHRAAHGAAAVPSAPLSGPSPTSAKMFMRRLHV